MLLHVKCLFHVQMLGSCPVFQAQGSGCTDEAVQKIVSNAKKVWVRVCDTWKCNRDTVWQSYNKEMWRCILDLIKNPFPHWIAKLFHSSVGKTVKWVTMSGYFRSF